MRNFISDILFILGEKKIDLPIIFFSFFILSLIEVLSISILAPYISLVNDSEQLQSYFSEIDFLHKYISEISHQKLFFLIGIFLIFIFLIKTFLFIHISKKILTFTWNVQIYLREKLVYKYQNLEYSLFVKKNSSELVTKLLRLIGVFNGRVVQHLLKLCSELIILVAIFILLFYTNYKILVIISILSFILGTTYYILFKKKLFNYGKLSNLTSKNALNYLNEIFSAFKEIRVLSKEKYFRNLFIKESKYLADYSIKSTLITISPRLIIEFIIIFIIIITSITYVYYDDGLFETNDLIIYVISAIRVIPSLNVLITSISHIRYGKPTVDDLKIEFENFKIETIDAQKKKKLKNNFKKINSIEFRNINFSFDDKVIFQNTGLKLQKGKLYGLSGKSGSGKSTLVNIILGFYRSSNLKLTINNSLIDNSNWPSDIFFYIPQDFHIFDKDLEFNISLSDKTNKHKLNKAINLAQLCELTKNLPNDVKSKIGEKGSKISGGEKQRVAIARAFYNSREIIIFDESTSGLDEKTETEIYEILKKLSKERIILIISHKTQILKKYCDIHFKLQGKKIVIND